jgi:tRNA (cmo5U34)-methyltransferase
MMNTAAATFDAHASEYDAHRRRLIPPYDAFYGNAVGVLGDLIPGGPKRVLDLGAGTGLLTRHLLAAYPNARVTLHDGAAAMLEEAKQALDATGNVDEYVVADLTDPLPHPSDHWCAIVSGLAIHHLSDDEKRDLFTRVRTALKPGGVFVNAEQIKGASPLFDNLNAVWHEHNAKQAGASDDDWRAAERRMEHDQCSTVEDQLTWLREAGFEHADCVFKDHRFAVLVATSS